MRQRYTIMEALRNLTHVFYNLNIQPPSELVVGKDFMDRLIEEVDATVLHAGMDRTPEGIMFMGFIIKEEARKSAEDVALGTLAGTIEINGPNVAAKIELAVKALRKAGMLKEGE